LFKRVWPQSVSVTLRFRTKVMLGFSVVLAITAISMGIAYLGFERVSSGVAVYRKSVSEADLARDIDRELVSYRALARTFVSTGKGDDSAVALVAEASLKDAIDRSIQGTTNSERLEQLTRLAGEFRGFTKVFCRYSQTQGRERNGGANPAHAPPAIHCAGNSTISRTSP